MDLIGTILLAGIGLVIGLLLGILIVTLRKDSSPKPPSPEPLLSDPKHSVRILREGKERRLVISMDGVSHYRRSDLNDDQSRNLAGLIRELQTWMGISPESTVSPQSEASKPPTPVIVEETQSTSLNPLKIFGRSLQPLEKTGSDDPAESIVTQIDEILQAKLAGTHLDDQGIHLVEGPDQSMEIQVGLSSYVEIEAIPDAQVRQLIRISVAEWENSLPD